MADLVDLNSTVPKLALNRVEAAQSQSGDLLLIIWRTKSMCPRKP
jgi:hypothetical protein